MILPILAAAGHAIAQVAQVAERVDEATETSDAFGHHSVRDIKRANGQSAVKTGAYITAQSMFDERVGQTFGRPEKSGRVLAVGTVGPKGAKWDAAEVWSGAETAESRKNSRTAQERVVALPEELDQDTHKRLLNGYSLWLRDEYGVAATWALHAPNDKGDQRNTHGHILTTTRKVSAGEDGKPQFGEKVRALSGDRATVSAELEKQRGEWSKRVNKELERAGSPRRMDHRSHERRAAAGDAPVGIEAATHKGPKGAALERRNPKCKKKSALDQAGRMARNAGRKAVWVGSQQAKVARDAKAFIAQFDAMTSNDTKEAAAAAQWSAQQSHEWECWRREETAKAKAAEKNP